MVHYYWLMVGYKNYKNYKKLALSSLLYILLLVIMVNLRTGVLLLMLLASFVVYWFKNSPRPLPQISEEHRVLIQKLDVLSRSKRQAERGLRCAFEVMKQVCALLTLEQLLASKENILEWMRLYDHPAEFSGMCWDRLKQLLEYISGKLGIEQRNAICKVFDGLFPCPECHRVHETKLFAKRLCDK